MRREVFTALAFVVAVSAFADAVDKDYAHALTFGADAALNVFVHDENGQPVEGAKIDYAFWLMNLKQTVSKTGVTDKTGHYLAKGKCSMDVHLGVSCEGYYSSRIKRNMSSFCANPRVSNGKWQPFRAELPILLRKKKNPVALDRCDVSLLKVPVLNEWIGFDMAEGDFVQPYGVGGVTDFSIRYAWDGKVRSEYTGSQLEIKFASAKSGGYWFDKIQTSVFQGCMSADTNSVFESEFHFFEKRNGKKWTSYRFPTDKTLVVRSRCLIDDKGQLTEAYYGQVGSIEFSKSHDGSAYFRIGYTRNPQVNDPNLEPEKDRYRTIRRRKGSGK